MPELVDSHCHLPLIERGERSMRDLLSAAAAHGVGHMLCVAVDLPSADEVRDLAALHPEVFASVGVHPNGELGATEPDVATLVERAGLPRVVAVGETGLDYFRQSGNLEWQRTRFRTHIRVAIEANRPLIVHMREAAADVIRVLREEHAERAGGVMHCFVDDWDTASAALDLGFYISFSGIVTFKSARQVQAVARRVPADRLLVETDAPWLAPVPHRGAQNEPAYVRHTAEYLAALREVDLATLARETTDNFFRLFATASR